MKIQLDTCFLVVSFVFSKFLHQCEKYTLAFLMGIEEKLRNQMRMCYAWRLQRVLSNVFCPCFVVTMITDSIPLFDDEEQ